MYTISKKSEYGILAMQYLASSGSMVSVKELSAKLNLSYDFLAKVLQSLLKNDLVGSKQGIKGGYYINRDPQDISIMNVIKALDETTALVECASGTDEINHRCNRFSFCTLKGPLSIMQKKIDDIFLNTTIYDIMDNLPAENENISYESSQIIPPKNLKKIKINSTLKA